MGTVTLPLREDGWTVDDLDLLPDDELHYELVDGCLRVSPPPLNAHDSAAFELGCLLKAVLSERWRVLVPGGVQFDSRNLRAPDLIVLRRRSPMRRYAPPEDLLLAVEVMSQASISEDRIAKPAQYAAAGIAHFWRIEPAHRVLITYVLEGAGYRESARFTDEVSIADPVRLTFRLGTVLD